MKKEERKWQEYEKLRIDIVLGLNCATPYKRYVKSPNISKLTLFGSRVFTEVIKLKMRSLGWVLIQYDCYLIKRGNLDTEINA
jgi:hypothetical protein